MESGQWSRRTVLAGGSAAAAALVMGADPVIAGPGYSSLAEEAVVWGFPLVFFGLYLDAAIANGVAFNRFSMSSQVANARSKAVGPNIDTLNGRAWLDLAAGPQVIAVPDTADRYYTVQLQDMYMNSFSYIGRRTTGTGPGAYAITPPGFAGALPNGVTAIPAPTGKVLAFVRTLVNGADDLDNARAINAAMTIGPLSDYPRGQVAAHLGEGALDAFQPASRSRGLLPHQEVAQSGAAFFDRLDHLLAQYPPSPVDVARAARFAPLGIGGSRDPALTDAELAAAVEGGVALAVRSVQSWPENGWLRRRNVEGVPADPLVRAADNIYGPGTQVAEESVFYNLRKGLDGTTLNGANRYRMRFPAGGLPPVDAFWSLTLYDGNYFLFGNPLDRYGLNDRTEGLRLGEDGSLELWVQAEPPPSGTANWLPAPQGDFQLVFRTYQPRQPILDGSYRLPPLEKVG